MPLQEIPPIEPIVLIDAENLPNGQLGVTVPLYTGYFETKTLYVKATGDTKVVVKGGPNESDMYELKSGDNVDTEDADREWDCNNESICFQIISHIQYIQVTILNEQGADITISAALSGG